MARVTSIGGIVTAHLLTVCRFIQGFPLVQLFERQGETVLVRYQPLLNVLFPRFVEKCFQIKMVLVEVLPSGGK